MSIFDLNAEVQSFFVLKLNLNKNVEKSINLIQSVLKYTKTVYALLNSSLCGRLYLVTETGIKNIHGDKIYFLYK